MSDVVLEWLCHRLGYVQAEARVPQATHACGPAMRLE